jgi:hypothetical protein
MRWSRDGSAGGGGVNSENARALTWVVFEEDEWTIAHCLEIDLCCGSMNPQDLARRLARQVKTQFLGDELAGREPFSTLPKAPERFWRMAEGAKEAAWGEVDSALLHEAELVCGVRLKFLRAEAAKP